MVSVAEAVGEAQEEMIGSSKSSTAGTSVCGSASSRRRRMLRRSVTDMFLHGNSRRELMNVLVHSHLGCLVLSVLATDEGFQF